MKKTREGHLLAGICVEIWTKNFPNTKQEKTDNVRVT